MAGNSLNQWSWSEILARHNKAGDQLLQEVDALVQQNDLLMDAPVRESNLINGEEFTVTTSLPQPYLHSRGEGRSATKGQVQHGAESVAWFTNQMRVNVEDLEGAANKAEFLRREEMKYLEGMNQSLAEMFIYGSTATEPKEFDGLDVRYDTLATDSVFSQGGSDSGNLTDIWFIQWDSYDCCMIYPKGERGGIYRTPHPDTCLTTELDAGTTSDAENKVAWYTMVDFDWKGGFCLRDPRRVKRLCNIHKTPGHADSLSVDMDTFDEVVESFDTPGMIYAYMNKKVRTQIRQFVNSKGNVAFPPGQPFAKPVLYKDDVPCRRVDRIRLTGTTIS